MPSGLTDGLLACGCPLLDKWRQDGCNTDLAITEERQDMPRHFSALKQFGDKKMKFKQGKLRDE